MRKVNSTTAFALERVYMSENCPECGKNNEVVDELWFHGVVSYFLCDGCDVLFGQSPDGTFQESRYYYEEIKAGYSLYEWSERNHLIPKGNAPWLTRPAN